MKRLNPQNPMSHHYIAPKQCAAYLSREDSQAVYIRTQSLIVQQQRPRKNAANANLAGVRHCQCTSCTKAVSKMCHTMQKVGKDNYIKLTVRRHPPLPELLLSWAPSSPSLRLLPRAPTPARPRSTRTSRAFTSLTSFSPFPRFSTRVPPSGGSSRTHGR